MRTALVTGANRGIGRAIAAGLVEHGNIRVLVAARRATDAGAVADDLGAATVGVTLDLSDATLAASGVRAIDETHGPIDILVNNAGVLTEGTGLATTPTDLLSSLVVNAVSPYALTQTLGAGMKARGWGRVVNISSGWGSFAEGLGGPVAYSVSKATLNALTVSLARTLSPEVKVNAACPGWVRTRMGGGSAPLSPEQGADTPLWLATLTEDGPTGGFFRDRRPIEW